MGVKVDNLELISGLLWSPFILNYMVIRLKENERENDREKRETKRKAKVLGDSLLDREFFGGGRLWFLCYFIVNS